MSKKSGQKKSHLNFEYVQIVPKFLQGKIKASQPNKDDYEDDNGEVLHENKHIEPELDDRPDREDEAPVIVADDDIMALLAKQNVVHKDGMLHIVPNAENPPTEVEKVVPTPKDDEAQFGSKKKKTTPKIHQLADSKQFKEEEDQSQNLKKRKAEEQLSDSPQTKKIAKNKAKLSFEDQEDI